MLGTVLHSQQAGAVSFVHEAVLSLKCTCSQGLKWLTCCEPCLFTWQMHADTSELWMVASESYVHVDAELVSWAQSKGLTQLTPGMLLEPSFADGRLLCRLVELLRRCTLAGIEWHSPSIAASRHNIAKVC